MAERSAERSEVRARILYWGPEGAGTSTNLAHVARKLRSDHRGELRRVPTALDPTTTYEVLPISLGEIAGNRVELQVVAVPGAPEHGPTRKQLLDRADGVVLVMDASPGRLEADLEAFDELRRSLAAYGRSLGDLPLVVQYNKCDGSDELALEELHRKLDLGGVAVFEAVAREGKGVLPTLTTISKRVIRHLREGGMDEIPPREPRPAREPEDAPPLAQEPRPAPLRPEPEPEPEPESLPPLHPVEAGILAEESAPEEAAEAEALTRRAEEELPAPWEEPLEASLQEEKGEGSLRLASVGAPRRAGEHDLVVPLEIEDAEGRRLALRLAVRLDLLEGSGEEG